jgi:Uma2 family endonuclease
MQPVATVTEDEYLAAERVSTTKHELVHGHVVAMAGASPRHNAICANLLAVLGARLRSGPCRALTSDQRVHVPSTGLYTYPDVTVVCGQPVTHAKDRHTLLNPTVLVEVLSPDTEAYDRGAKFHHFQSIESFREYVLVGSSERRIEHYRRIEDRRWELTSHVANDAIVELPALGIAMPSAGSSTMASRRSLSEEAAKVRRGAFMNAHSITA